MLRTPAPPPVMEAPRSTVLIRDGRRRRRSHAARLVVTTLRDVGHCVFAAYDAEAACELALEFDDVDLMITNTRLGTVRRRSSSARSGGASPTFASCTWAPFPIRPACSRTLPDLQEPITFEALLAAVRELLAGRETRA